eukprot:TRINITY_DN28756_c0_g1_i1.p1 TRINITY_DN28756_c0_g1~~TRINITY_DN28756_c0_g1_i1.p1  ORF type:complete len:203 (-),score=44.93 TRINITY_DN28756_c0_g1_i1:334-942(-)
MAARSTRVVVAKSRSPLRRSKRLSETAAAAASSSAALRSAGARSSASAAAATRLSSLEVEDAGRFDGLFADPWEDASDSERGGSDYDDGAPGAARARGASRGGRGAGRGARARGGGGPALPRKAYKRRTLEGLLQEEAEALDLLAGVNGDADAAFEAKPSERPRRPLCIICCCAGRYACRRCGKRFCSSACGETHREVICSA